MRAEDTLRLFVGGGAGGRMGAAGAAGAAGEAIEDPVAPLAPFAPGAEFELPGAAATHVKVRRLQPGATLRLFDGSSGNDWPAEVLAITRSAVRVRLAAAPVAAAAAELPVAVALAFGMPANERVDALVEKATELGVAALWPLMSERSVLRLQGERAERRRAHWQAVAAAACEQCGRACVPKVHGVRSLQDWLQKREGDADALVGGGVGAGTGAVADDDVPTRWLLSTQPDAPPLARMEPPRPRASPPARARVLVLSGPEGGLTLGEIEAACAAGFTAVSLGARILRADTAPLAALAWLAVALAQRPEPKSGA